MGNLLGLTIDHEKTQPDMHLLIRADASTQIGTGHIMRCLALAQAWIREGGQVTLLMATSVPMLEARLQKQGISIAHLSIASGSHEDAQKTVVYARALSAIWVVVDGYQFGTEYQQIIKEAGLQLLFIDDYGHAEYYWADLVLNQNLYACEELYSNREPNTQLLLGTHYALLREEFWSWKTWQRQTPEVIRKVLVTLGGADPDNVTLKVIQALQQIDNKEFETIVIVGGSNPHHKQLQNTIEKTTALITLQYNVIDMPKLMSWADVAISAGGSTSWELLFMGLPSLLIILAENQRSIVEQLHDRNAAHNVGWHTDLTADCLKKALVDLCSSPRQYQQIAQQAQDLVDAQGSLRVTQACLNY